MPGLPARDLVGDRGDRVGVLGGEQSLVSRRLFGDVRRHAGSALGHAAPPITVVRIYRAFLRSLEINHKSLRTR
jgi:hypothetical protein